MARERIGSFAYLLPAVWLLSLAFGSTGLASQSDRKATLYTDTELSAMIAHDLGRVRINGKSVEVLGGIVTLRGEVSSIGEKNEAAAIAAKVPQVKDVENEIAIVWDASDREIAQTAIDRLNGYVHYTIYDGVQCEVANGVLHLAGRVTQSHKVQEIGTLLSKTPGVRAVENEIRVIPFVASDEDVRVGVAVALYRALPDYAEAPMLPLHVVVENARVTLEGTVRTGDERRTAEQVTRTVPGVAQVDNRLVLLPT